MSAPTRTLADLFTLGADWELQGSGDGGSKTLVEQTGSNGDVIAESVSNTVRAGSVRYIYTGAEAAFPAALLAALANVGNVMNSLFLILSVGIDYGPCAQQKRPIVTFTWRDGPTAAGAIYVPNAAVITLPTYSTGIPLVPTIFAVTADSGEVINATYELRAEFGEDLDASGDFLAGGAYKGRETIVLTVAGKLGSLTSTGYLETVTPGSGIGEQSNMTYNTTTHTFTRKVAREV